MGVFIFFQLIMMTKQEKMLELNKNNNCPYYEKNI
jgi:hypothetical protein